MQVIQPREYERKMQLLPGTAEREAALVGSVEELKMQMDKANNDAAKRRNTLIIVSSIVATAVIFLSGARLSNLLKILGSVLSISALVKGASNMKSIVKELPRSDEFSARDRAYSFITRINDVYNSSFILNLAVKVTLDVMLATKLITPLNVKVKQEMLKHNQLKAREDIKQSILKYEPR